MPSPRRWHGPALVAAIVAAVLVGAVATTQVADGLRSRFQIDRRQDEVALPPAPLEPGGDTGNTRLGCRPEPCELWRTTAVDGRPVEVTDDLVLHAGRSELVAFDLATGARRWSQPLPGAERTDAGTADVLHASGGVVVVAYGRHGQAEAEVLAFDLTTGDPRFETPLDDVALISQIHRRGDELLVAAGPRDPASGSRPVLFVVGEDGGEVRRREEPPRLIALEDWLLERDDTTVVAVRVDDGAETWRREGAILDLDPVGGLVLLRSPAGGVEVIDIGTGEVVGALAAGQAETVQFIGHWVGLRTEGAMRVVDPATGREILTRDVDPGDEGVQRHVQHLALRRHTVVVWPQGTGHDVVVYDQAGSETADRTMGLGSDDWVGLAPVPGRPDLVLITSVRGRSSSWLDLRTGTTVREVSGDETGSRSPPNFRDGLNWTSGPTAMEIHGPDGSMTVEGATKVVSTDPLVVHGPAGLLRLDPRPLLGSPDAAG